LSPDDFGKDGFNVAATPLTAEPTEETQIDSQVFTIRTVDHDETVAMLMEILAYQKAHPEIYYYTRSRSYYRTDPKNADQEQWFLFDEYDNREAYWQSLMSAAQNDPKSAANQAAFLALLVGPPPTGHLVWTEIKELRVHYEFREPLWPGCRDETPDTPQDAITATPTADTLIDQQYFTIRKSDHDKAIGLFSEILAYQKAHPEIYYYTRSRSFLMEDPDNPEHERWMFIDEFDNREVYWQSLMDAAANDADSAANMAAFQALVVPPPPTGHLVWTELTELRVQYEDREPLWPGCIDSTDGS
jgi:hypothetical protein